MKLLGQKVPLLGALGLLVACSSSNSPQPETTGSGGSTSSIGGAPTSATGGKGAADTGGTAAGGSAGSGGQDAKNDGGSPEAGGAPQLPADLKLLDSVVFYDGYAAVTDEPVPEGVVRLDNALVTTKLTDAQLALIQPHLMLEVMIGALCDNYDRIGSVRLALTPKGATIYEPGATPHIEVARFVTPFMDQNREPSSVPYSWNIDHVAAILRSSTLRADHDFWLELSVFGVPYAANDEVAGCAGRSDVFTGSLTLSTDSTAPATDVDLLLPLAFDAAFNDYQAGASDQIGTTKKTLTFSLEQAVEDAQIVLILSNHGANSGGEEYIRREHFVELDGEPALTFRPGRSSCEPFRQFNTQANGIYGQTARSDQDWQSFSNWCPGDVIDTRIIDWGAVSAGEHEFLIDVPEAEFTGDEGNFPLSVFVMARL